MEVNIIKERKLAPHVNRSPYRFVNSFSSVVFFLFLFIPRSKAADITPDFIKMLCFNVNAYQIYLVFQDGTLDFKEMICFAVNDYVIYFLFQDHPT